MAWTVHPLRGRAVHALAVASVLRDHPGAVRLDRGSGRRSAFWRPLLLSSSCSSRSSRSTSRRRFELEERKLDGASGASRAASGSGASSGAAWWIATGSTLSPYRKPSLARTATGRSGSAAGAVDREEVVAFVRARLRGGRGVDAGSEVDAGARRRRDAAAGGRARSRRGAPHGRSRAGSCGWGSRSRRSSSWSRRSRSRSWGARRSSSSSRS